MTRRDHPRGEVLSQAFGPLEIQVLEVLWRERRPTTVRDLQPALPRFAYTTLMTTLDRLHRKGVLERTKVGRAFAYEAGLERAELEARLASRSIEQLLGAASGRRSLEPLLSLFVNAVGERDRRLLDDLEKLLQDKRSRLDRGDSR